MKSKDWIPAFAGMTEPIGKDGAIGKGEVLRNYSTGIMLQE